MTIESFDTASFLKGSIQYFELSAALVGTLYYYKYRDTKLVYFLYLLWFTVLVEFTSYFLGFKLLTNSFWLYNYIYHPVNFTVLLLLFSIFVKKIQYVQTIRTFVFLFLMVYFIYMMIEDYMSNLIMVPFIIGSIFIIVSISFYFIELLNSNKVLYVSKNLLFWASVGFLIYFAGKIPMRLIRNSTGYLEEIVSYDALSITGSLLSIIMNICFIIGFIWSERRYLY